MVSILRKIAVTAALMLPSLWLSAQKADYSVVSVQAENGLEFKCLTSDGDYVCMPLVQRTSKGVNWYTNRVISVSPDGKTLAFLSARNGSTNVFIKEIAKRGGSTQRTSRSAVTDFTYSPDGKKILFSESAGKNNQVYITDASSGFVCQQITSGNKDYSPTYSPDMKKVFFARQEARSTSIWSYDLSDKFLSNYSQGLNPQPIGKDTFLCVRTNSYGNGEIWKVNYSSGLEECLVSSQEQSFSSPILSHNGKWILMVGSSTLDTGKGLYYNTDIYVVRIDGTSLTQLTYHAADDLSPAWSVDDKYVYFISQRGSANGTANIWQITFNY